MIYVLTYIPAFDFERFQVSSFMLQASSLMISYTFDCTNNTVLGANFCVKWHVGIQAVHTRFIPQETINQLLHTLKRWVGNIHLPWTDVPRAAIWSLMRFLAISDLASKVCRYVSAHVHSRRHDTACMFESARFYSHTKLIFLRCCSGWHVVSFHVGSFRFLLHNYVEYLNVFRSTTANIPLRL